MTTKIKLPQNILLHFGHLPDLLKELGGIRKVLCPYKPLGPPEFRLSFYFPPSLGGPASTVSQYFTSKPKMITAPSLEKACAGEVMVHERDRRVNLQALCFI